MEIIYGFELPDELFDRADLTLGEFADELSKLSIIIPDEQYLEFFDIKFNSLQLTKRYFELETKTDEDSINELDEIKNQFDLLTVRLNILLGNTLVN
jgi:nitrate reductase assembly molybdenum cofactor insertion protein NarJ